MKPEKKEGNPISVALTKKDREDLKRLAKKGGRDVSSHLRYYGITKLLQEEEKQ